MGDVSSWNGLPLRAVRSETVSWSALPERQPAELIYVRTGSQRYQWKTGLCMLYCRRAEVWVLWIGSVTAPAGSGDMYGCATCIHELNYIVACQLHEQDLSALSAR